MPGNSYAGKLGSKTGLNIAKELGWDELQTQIAVKTQNAQITCLNIRAIVPPIYSTSLKKFTEILKYPGTLYGDF